MDAIVWVAALREVDPGDDDAGVGNTRHDTDVRGSIVLRARVTTDRPLGESDGGESKYGDDERLHSARRIWLIVLESSGVWICSIVQKVSALLYTLVKCHERNNHFCNAQPTRRWLSAIQSPCRPR